MARLRERFGRLALAAGSADGWNLPAKRTVGPLQQHRRTVRNVFSQYFLITALFLAVDPDIVN
jgi:hypothetical protein